MVRWGALVEAVCLTFAVFAGPAGLSAPPGGGDGAATTTQLINLSARLRVETGSRVGIAGFVVEGTAPKQILIRALGPSLLALGVTGVVSNPSLQIYDSSGNVIARNDDWQTQTLPQSPVPTATDISATGLAPGDARESAVLLTVQPGAYTGIVSGVSGEMGVALIEVYDVSSANAASLINVSTRGQVGIDANVMIAGFIIQGPNSKKVIARAIGPSLAAAGVSGALQNPTLALYNAAGQIIAQNDDFGQNSAADLAAIASANLTPQDAHESALYAQLPPGAYTAIVRGVGDTTGTALVEIYDADAIGIPTAQFYIAPNGDDSNPGDIDHPFATLNKAWTVVAPGDLIFMRGGRYEFATQQFLTGRSGTPGNLIKVWAYPNETPILTKRPNYTHTYYRGGCYFSGDYVHFKGLEITGFTQEDAFVWNGLLVLDANHNIFEQLNVHHNGGGLYIQGNSTGNLVLNSDFHHNYDPLTSGGNADGLDVAYVAAGTTNTVRGCRSWWNSDDGFDAWSNDGEVVFENNWSWYNGYMPDTFTQSGDGTGFKLGLTAANPTALLRILRNNVAFKNRANGYDKNGAQVRMDVFNNVAYDNGTDGFHLDNPASHNFKNNISYGNHRFQVIIALESTSDHNSASGGAGELNNWNDNVSSADFLSMAIDGMDGPRRPDGSLPVVNFLRLAPTSGLIDAGIDVGLPFLGAAPDRGAFETNY